MREYNNEVDLRRWLREIKRYRILYVLSFVFFMGIATVYYLRSMPMYTADAVLLIEDPTEKAAPAMASGTASLARMFSIGGFGSTSVDNELAIIKSNELRERVIRELGLNFSYILRDGLKRKVLFNESPVKVEAPVSLLDTLKHGFLIKVHLHDGKLTATATKGRLFKKKIGEIKDAALPCVLHTDYGDFSIDKTPEYDPAVSEKIDVPVVGTPKMSEIIEEALKVDVNNLKADAINLMIKDTNPQKGVAILDALMEAYNDKRLERRRIVAQEEVDYYSSRLNALFVDLNEAEGRIEQFKSENKLSGIGKETDVLVGKALSGKEEAAKLKAELNYFNQVVDILKGNLDGSVLIPVAESFGNPMIAEYNRMVAERKKLVLSATPENINLKILDENLSALRKSILQNAEGVIRETRHELSALEQNTNVAVSRLDKMPHYEREYQNLFRDQNLKNELYVFLLQKRESSDLKLHSNATLGFIVDKAYVETKPKNTKALIVCLLALALAFIAPTCVILFMTRWRNSVYDHLDMPSPVLKQRSYVCGDSDKDMGEAAWYITDGMKRHVIYVAGYECDPAGIGSRMAASINDMGYKARMLQSKSQHTYSLLAAGFTDDIQRLAADGDVVIIPVPDASNISVLSDRLNSQNATLVIAVRCAEMNRKKIAGLTVPFEPERLYVLIMK